MKELMRQANITQIELAGKLNVTQGLISQWVRGICEPRIEQLPLIAQMLGVSVDEVIACFKKTK